MSDATDAGAPASAEDFVESVDMRDIMEIDHTIDFVMSTSLGARDAILAQLVKVGCVLAGEARLTRIAIEKMASTVDADRNGNAAIHVKHEDELRVVNNY